MPPDGHTPTLTVDEIVAREAERERVLIAAELHVQSDEGWLTAAGVERRVAQLERYMRHVRELAELAHERGIADPFSSALSAKEKEHVWQLRDELFGRDVIRRGGSLLPMFAQLKMDRRSVVRKAMERGFSRTGHRVVPAHILTSVSLPARPRMRRTRRRAPHRSRAKPRSDPSEPEPPRRRSQGEGP